MKHILISFFIILTGVSVIGQQRTREEDSIARRRVQDSLRALTEQDHKEMLATLNIKTLRQGANGNNPNAPNAANYDESKANPFPILPAALVLKNGKVVSSPEEWWKNRRPEIVEDFDREIYGRTPAITPKVNWQLIKEEKNINNNI
ncbi:MAG: acetylxylan esterase, partial [Chitinophagaceae bacterium]